MTTGVHVWSKTASSNASADTSINWAEGQAASSVNDSARAMMARVSEYRDDNAGALTTAGTATAFTLTTNTVFTTLALLSGVKLSVKFNATNGASPTLNVDGLGAKALQTVSGTAIPTSMLLANSIWDVTYDNSIPAFIVHGVPNALPSGTLVAANVAFTGTQKILGRFSASSGNGEELTLGTGILLSGAGVLSAAPSAGVTMINGTIVETQGSSAATYALKTLAGADPSASDPVYLIFRNVTTATGNFVVRTVTAALSLTIPNTALMGFPGSGLGKIWVGALDNAGTPELFVVNCLNGTSIYPLGQFPIITTTILDTGADNAGVPYSTTARTSKPYIVLGYLDYGTAITPGVWATLATRIQLYGPNVPLPGSIIQSVTASTTTVGSTASASYATLTNGPSVAITLTSINNLVRVTAQGTLLTPASASAFVQLQRGSTLIGNPINGANSSTTNAINYPTFLFAVDAPGSLSAQTYSFQGKTNSGTMNYPPASTGSYMEAQEVMA